MSFRHKQTKSNESEHQALLLSLTWPFTQEEGRSRYQTIRIGKAYINQLKFKVQSKDPSDAFWALMRYTFIESTCWG